MGRDSMSRTVSKTSPPSHPPVAGRLKGETVQPEFDFDSKRPIIEHIKGVYAAFKKAIDAFGGEVALAAYVERDLSDVQKRVAREQDTKGNLKQAFLDYVGVLGLDHAAREIFLFALCDLWGYKHPEAYREPSVEEKYRTLLSRLSGAAGEAILKDAADAGGFNVGAFRR